MTVPLATICAHIRATLPDCTPASVAAHFALSRFHLSRRFHRETGLPLRDYIAALKIEHGIAALVAQKPVIDSQLDAGHESAATYSHTFRAATGIAPARYRDKIAAYSANTIRRSLLPSTAPLPNTTVRPSHPNPSISTANCPRPCSTSTGHATSNASNLGARHCPCPFSPTPLKCWTAACSAAHTPASSCVNWTVATSITPHGSSIPLITKAAPACALFTNCK